MPASELFKKLVDKPSNDSDANKRGKIEWSTITYLSRVDWKIHRQLNESEWGILKNSWVCDDVFHSSWFSANTRHAVQERQLRFNSAPSAIGEIADTDRCASPICSSVSLPRARLCSCCKSDVIRAALYSPGSTGRKSICSVSKKKQKKTKISSIWREKNINTSEKRRCP